MTSSQALAQSVFANLGFHNKLGLLADLRGDDRLPPFPSVWCDRGPARRPLRWSIASTTWASRVRQAWT